MFASRSQRPVGLPTRGTTNPNRLRRMDRWLVQTQAWRWADAQRPLIVDLGFGASASTALELHARVRESSALANTVGIEIDPARVESARQYERDGLSFVRGGFEIPTAEEPHVIRAFNVLRQYSEEDYLGHWDLVRSRLAPKGIFIDGTCDEIGRRATWVSLDRNGPLSLSIAVKFGAIERPSDVAERLPKALIHRNVPGERIHDVLGKMDRAWDVASPLQNFGRRARWMAMAHSVYRELSGREKLPAPTSVWGGPKRWRLGEFSVPWELVEPA